MPQDLITWLFLHISSSLSYRLSPPGYLIGIDTYKKLVIVTLAGINSNNKTINNVFRFDRIAFFGTVYKHEDIILHFIIKQVLPPTVF